MLQPASIAAPKDAAGAPTDSVTTIIRLSPQGAYGGLRVMVISDPVPEEE